MFEEAHITLRGKDGRTEFHCHGCGTSVEAPVGLTIISFNAKVQAFLKVHRACGNRRKQILPVDNIQTSPESGHAASDDLAFLREIQERLSAGVERGDPTQIEYAREMIRDWIDELENR